VSGYVEAGGSWRPFWLVAGALGVFLMLDLVLPGGDVPGLLWGAFIGCTLGIIGVSAVQAQRAWSVRVDDDGHSVGRETVPLRDVDVDHLRAVDSGVDAGAPVLGGGWSLPKGRAGLPLRLTDGRTLLVPTREPAALYEALLRRVSDTTGGPPGSQGTLGS